MDRSNHYEAAFEAYLKAKGLCYMVLDETRRSSTNAVPLKSIDFIVYCPDWRLLVDVKGRRFPCGSGAKQRQTWECWSTREDIVGLKCWAEKSGTGFKGLLVFNYCLAPNVELPLDTEDLWEWRGQRYLFRGVAVEDYEQKMRVRSPKWGTVTLPRGVFRQLVRPLHHFFYGPALVADDFPL